MSPHQQTIGLLLVGGAMALEALGQLCFKHTANRSVHGVDPVALMLHGWKHHWLYVGIACFVIEAFVWTLALSKLPISVAYPAGSICFVFVALFSRLILKEHVERIRWYGIGLILAGVALVMIQIP